jgi:ABC-2 type transport system ATP-binding protein
MLKLDGLWKHYGAKPVLQNLTLTLHPGEIYGLLGPNGAGKTTTINIICGLLQADEGTVTLAGQPIGAATKGLIGVMPQGNLLYASLSCQDNLAFIGRLYGLSRQDSKRRIQTCLEAVNLQAQATMPVEQLSGGMRRRLCLAMTLLHKPKLVILDEPTTGLDIEARQEVWQLIRQLQQMGMTVLLTSHLLDEVERLCQRIGIIKQGVLLAEGTLPELKRHVPAAEIVTVQTNQPEAAIARAHRYGYKARDYGPDLHFWVPTALDLKTLLEQFEGIPINSIACHPVGLEHIYLEITRQHCPETLG